MVAGGVEKHRCNGGVSLQQWWAACPTVRHHHCPAEKGSDRGAQGKGPLCLLELQLKTLEDIFQSAPLCLLLHKRSHQPALAFHNQGNCFLGRGGGNCFFWGGARKRSHPVLQALHLLFQGFDGGAKDRARGGLLLLAIALRVHILGAVQRRWKLDWK